MENPEACPGSTNSSCGTFQGLQFLLTNRVIRFMPAPPQASVQWHPPRLECGAHTAQLQPQVARFYTFSLIWWPHVFVHFWLHCQLGTRYPGTRQAKHLPTPSLLASMLSLPEVHSDGAQDRKEMKNSFSIFTTCKHALCGDLRRASKPLSPSVCLI